MVFVLINGNKERIDNFCGSEMPAQLMSNGPSIRVEFRSVKSTARVRGFKAQYNFITSKCVCVCLMSLVKALSFFGLELDMCDSFQANLNSFTQQDTLGMNQRNLYSNSMRAMKCSL